MKKKGFTLIELLAVIVIIAVIALILVPVVGNIVEGARKAAFRESVGGVIDSASSHLQNYVLKNHDGNSVFPVTFTCDGTSCSNGTDTLVFKGAVPVSGNIVITEDGIMAEYITYGKYCAYGYKWDLIIEKDCIDVDATKPVITGVKNGKVITLTMTDVGSGIDKYCANTTDTTEGCSWVTPANPSSEEYTIESVGTRYFFARDKKGNISDSINFTTVNSDYCAYTIDQVVKEFSYSGDIQSYTVPSGCAGIYKLEVWGAAAGSVSGYSGGKGAYAYGETTLEGNTTLYVGVGGAGAGRCSSSGWGSGGYNGGGSGHSYGNSGDCGSGGGGATHIGKTENLLKDTAQADVYLVAGGGGGTFRWGGNGQGGTGGTGGSGGGASYGQGGNGNSSYCSGGGGGGWSGGSGGPNNGSVGNGGTSYVGGVTKSGTATGNQTMPKTDGSGNMTGNGSSGYAKITFIGPGITITFNANGGTVSETQRVLETYGPIGEMPIPTKEGNYFYGWYSDRDFTQYVYPDTVIDRNTTLYARWSGNEIGIDYTGSVSAIRIPVTGTYKLEVWGAAGGSSSNYGAAGKGGYSTGTTSLTAGDVIYIAVGGKGNDAPSAVGDQSVAGGFNGGTGGFATAWSGDWNTKVGAGGGATHIGKTNATLANTTSENVYLVAGGGGGGNWGCPSHGCYENGTGANGGPGGGTAGGGGSYGAGVSNGAGGGYAGGRGVGGSTTTSAAGGTGYVGGVTNGQTISGNATMPTHDGTSTMTGNTGNGYAKITLLSS